jgi:hypothetical protein
MQGMTFHIQSPARAGGMFGTGTVVRLSGEPGVGFFRLTINVELVIEPADAEQDKLAVTEFEALARMDGGLVGRFTPTVMGYLPIRSYSGRVQRQALTLSCDLDRSRIAAIEAFRAGGNLVFGFSMHVRFSDGSSVSVDEGHIVNQGVWIDILREMGYQHTLLIEVPLPDAVTQPELAKAVADLEQAQMHMLAGHDRDAVGSLRDALEQVSLAFDDNEQIPPDVEHLLFANSRSMTKAERLRVLRRALKLVTHPARHRDQVTVAIDWSRTDAAEMITMVAAFINEMGAPGARPGQ